MGEGSVLKSGTFSISIPVLPQTQNLSLSFPLHVPHSPMFLLSYLTYIPWKWLFLPFYHTVHTPQALGRWKLLELFFPRRGSGKK